MLIKPPLEIACLPLNCQSTHLTNITLFSQYLCSVFSLQPIYLPLVTVSLPPALTALSSFLSKPAILFSIYRVNILILFRFSIFFKYLCVQFRILVSLESTIKIALYRSKLSLFLIRDLKLNIPCQREMLSLFFSLFLFILNIFLYIIAFYHTCNTL